MYFSGKAELTAGEMRDAGKRGPEAGGGAKGSEDEVVGLVHIFFQWGSFSLRKGGLRGWEENGSIGLIVCELEVSL